MRTHGTGTVCREGDGWRARLPLSLGRRSLGVWPTEREARKVLASALTLEADRPTQPRTVNDVVEASIATRQIRDNTRKADRGRWATYGEGSLGRESAHGLTATDVHRWWAKVRKDHPALKHATLSNLATVVRCAFPHLALDLDLPKRVKKLPDWLREHEIVRVLGCQAVPLRSRLIFAIRIYTGLRPGELWGLRWDDVDLDRGVLHIRHSRLELTKTSAEREIKLLWPAKAALLTWREIAPATRSGLVFPSLTTDTVYDDGYDGEWYEHRRLFRLGRRFVFYDLRHTFASHMLQGTWAPAYVARASRLEEVKDWLGHDNIATTQIYAHLCADSRHSLVRDCPDVLPADASHTGELNPGPTVYERMGEGPRLRAIHGGNALAGSESGNAPEEAMLDALARGGRIMRSAVVELALEARRLRALASLAPPRTGAR